MKVFAYGSNMSTARLQERAPSAQKVAVARLAGRAVRFFKRSVDGSGKATLFAESGSVAWGVIWEIPEAEKPALDESEGLGYGYHEERFEVIDTGGYRHDVIAYVADPDAIDARLVPYDWYMVYVLTGVGEHGLPTDYMMGLLTVPTMQDPRTQYPAKDIW